MPITERSTHAKGLLGLLRRRQTPAYTSFEEARRHEIAENMAILHAHRWRERQEKFVRHMIALWPVGAGLLVSAFAPLLKAGAEGIGPWAVTLLFPFVVLAERPEIQVGPITHWLPTIMLYAQFPIEGLLARIILRRRVRPLAVTGQVMLFHFLGIVELWMLSGTARELLRR